VEVTRVQGEENHLSTGHKKTDSAKQIDINLLCMVDTFFNR
jgi:hypothetical protein